jgi:polar amino acid transport system substrate-binding protein
MRLRLGLAVAAMMLVVGAPHGVAADTLERVKARGTMIFAAMPDALPQAGRDASGALRGFDIDVARELAARMGLGVSFETPTWRTVLEGNWKERWDLCVCSMTPTEEREKVLAFPAVYRMSPATLIVRKDNTRHPGAVRRLWKNHWSQGRHDLREVSGPGPDHLQGRYGHPLRHRQCEGGAVPRQP